MPVFVYKARTSGGKLISGQIDATNKSAALDAILSGGQTPISLRQNKKSQDWKAWFQSRERDLTAADAGAFAQDLSRLLSSGFSLHQALQMVAVSSESKRAQDLAQRSADHVGKGGALSDILRKEPGGAAQALSGLTQAGEASGELTAILLDAAENFNASADFRERLVSALIYPMIILFMISMTLIVFFSFVLPRLQPLFEGVDDRLPLATKVLLSFGHFCEIWLPWILLVGLISFVGLQLMPKLKDKLAQHIHGWFLGAIGMGAPRLAGFASYSRTLGLLINSGVPLATASHVAAGGVGNKKLCVLLEDMSGSLREGQKLSQTLTMSGLAPDVLLRMSYLGERSGKLGPALIDVAGILERKARTRTDRLLAALTPSITIFLGLLVALVVGALFLGIASLTDVDI